MEAPGTPAVASTTVASGAKRCIASFQQCLDSSAPIHPRELSLVEDQLARFSLWATNIKVFGKGRDSLDHRLRDAPDVRDIVVGLVDVVEYRLQDCRKILEAIDPLQPVPDGALPPVDTRLEEVLQDVSDEISLLHRFSNTIRKASRATQNQKAADGFRMLDSEGNDTEPLLRQLFSNYIRDRFSGVSEKIRDRLVDTMVLRRKRILYRRARYGTTPIRVQSQPSKPSIVRPNAVATAEKPIEQNPEPSQIPREPLTKLPSAVQSTAPTATTLSPESFKRASAPSVMSTSKTVALSSHQELRFPPVPCGSQVRKYNKKKAELEAKHLESLESMVPTKSGSREAALLGDISAEKSVGDKLLERDWNDCLDAIGEITCPFCFYALPAREAVDEKKWKLHVLGDLDPYVCLFEDCNNAHELYSRSNSWMKHMREHTLTWRCVSKSHAEFVASTRDEYLEHMKSAHPGKLTAAQLAVLADRSARMTVDLFKVCPLCGIEEARDCSMQDHVVGHLRALALQSLPSYEVYGEDEDMNSSDQGSLDNSRPRCRTTIMEDPDGDRLISYDDPQENFSPWVDFPDKDGNIPYEDPSSTWSFITDRNRLPSSDDWSNDPVLKSFVERARQPATRSAARKAPKSVIRMDPDCAICHAPAAAACECESRALEDCVRNAEKKIMSPIYNDVRDWAKQHSQDRVLEHFRRLVIREPRNTALDTPGLEDREVVVRPNPQGGELQESMRAASNLSKADVSRLWGEAYNSYAELLDHYFGMVELVLPDDSENSVKDPPIFKGSGGWTMVGPPVTRNQGSGSKSQSERTRGETRPPVPGRRTGYEQKGTQHIGKGPLHPQTTTAPQDEHVDNE